MDSRIQLDLQETNLRNLLATGAFQFADAATPWFPYTSGQIGPYYFQSTTIEKDGAAYATAIRSLAELIRAAAAPHDVISGGESRDWDFSNPVAVALRKPHLKLYKDGKALGAEVAGRAVLHVADLNNEGSSLRDCWKPQIEKRGGRLVGFVSFVDRLEDGITVLKELGVPALSVVPLNEYAWDLMLQGGAISAEAHRALLERMQDKRAWALRTLRAHPDYFRQMYRNPKTQAKALKIIQTYPEIREELEGMAKRNEP
jgi:orotate phosphoribosyltransferase